MSMSDGEIRTWADGAWHQGDVKVAGAADHGLWQGACVFDGARFFEGVAPDLDRHCARLNASARAMGLKPVMADGALAELAREGLEKFPSGKAVYVRPMYWSRSGGPSLIVADPDTTVFALCLEELAMPGPEDMPEGGITMTLTSFRRPMRSMMPVDAKAACLYPNNARMIREAREKGFGNALVLDALGNVAELATSNVFIVRDGVVATPIPNGTFLDGITRQRVIALMRAAGHEVVETVLSVEDVREADEIFSTGNALKVMPVVRFDDRELDFGPVAREARDRYWEFAHA